MMGIVNVTPDSFYDQGATAAAADAVAHGLALLERGAGALDVGGMTAQPGDELDPSIEIARVVPVIAAAARAHRRRDRGRYLPRAGGRGGARRPAPTWSTITPG